MKFNYLGWTNDRLNAVSVRSYSYKHCHLNHVVEEENWVYSLERVTEARRDSLLHAWFLEDSGDLEDIDFPWRLSGILNEADK